MEVSSADGWKLVCRKQGEGRGEGESGKTRDRKGGGEGGGVREKGGEKWRGRNGILEMRERDVGCKEEKEEGG